MRIDKGFGGMPAELTEVAMLPSEAARMRVSVGRVVVVENEVTYLAMPVPFQGVVVRPRGNRAVARTLSRYPQQEGGGRR